MHSSICRTIIRLCRVHVSALLSSYLDPICELEPLVYRITGKTADPHHIAKTGALGNFQNYNVLLCPLIKSVVRGHIRRKQLYDLTFTHCLFPKCETCTWFFKHVQSPYPSHGLTGSSHTSVNYPIVHTLMIMCQTRPFLIQ